LGLCQGLYAVDVNRLFGVPKIEADNHFVGFLGSFFVEEPVHTYKYLGWFEKMVVPVGLEPTT
jgi:hypothetical protein